MIDRHIEKSRERLFGDDYATDRIFQPSDYTWQGDWEGRALLAFSCLLELTGERAPALDGFFEMLSRRMNREGFLGEIFDPACVREQQLSGHSWLVAGLTKYSELTGDTAARAAALRIHDSLFARALPYYETYPLTRDGLQIGGVSGTEEGQMNGWRLSTDVGCAYMCIDGLSRLWRLTGEERVGRTVCALIDRFAEIDYVGLRMQTHATLSATRGISVAYEMTHEARYLALVKRNFDLYLSQGMTDTYENFNWFGRRDTWTEPCAVTDSLMLAHRLYELTGERFYLTLARRIWFNGLSFCHRANGGAGPNSCVTEEMPQLRISLFEAPFCCTMRYTEALVTVKKHQALYDDYGSERHIEEDGRVFLGDSLVVCDAEGRESPLATLVFPEERCGRYTVLRV